MGFRSAVSNSHTEENRLSAQDPIVDHQPHAFRCFQGVGLRLVLFDGSDGEIEASLQCGSSRNWILRGTDAVG
jgi:hypothetical protein